MTQGACWCHGCCRCARGRRRRRHPHGVRARRATPASVHRDSEEQILMWFQMMASGRLPFVVRKGAADRNAGIICGFLGDALLLSACWPRCLVLPCVTPHRRRHRLAPSRLAVGESRGKRTGQPFRAASTSERVRRSGAALSRDAAEHSAGGSRASRSAGRAGARGSQAARPIVDAGQAGARVATSRSVLAFGRPVGEPPILTSRAADAPRRRCWP